MIVTASRDKAFEEPFNFKNDKGQPLNLPIGSFSLSLERGDFVKVFDKLPTRNNSIMWRMTADEMKDLPYSSLYFVLYYNGQALTRGVLRVQ